MLSSEEYLIGWGMYLLGCLGLMVVWWRMTARVRPVLLRHLLWVSALVALLMPYPVPEQEAFLAPALMMTFLEGLFFEDYGFAHAGIPLLLALAIANVLFLIAELGWQAWRRKRDTSGEDGSAA